MLRQALISLLGFVFTSAQAQRVNLRAYQEADQIQLVLQAQQRGQPAQEMPDEAHPPDNRLEICANLMSALGGKAVFTLGEAGWQAVLDWKMTEERTLLVVDDNRELIDLYRRYLAGTGWLVLPAYSSSEARLLLKEKKPAAILLDIMMPGEDGWEFLEFLKSDPETEAIPALICSVVNEPTLAASLGAAGSLAKPVSQQALIQALSLWS
jgi:CheY-like chemotaxis protein